MSSKTASKSRLKFGWLPRSILGIFWSNVRHMWEDKTMKKHGRGLQNQALQTFGPDPVSDQILGRFWEQIGANFGSKIEQTSIEKLIDQPDARREGAARVKESFLGALTPARCTRFDPRGGGRGRGKPLPRGVVSSSLTQRGS